jgi:hypothetical protein
MDIDWTDDGDRRILAALVQGPALTPGLRAQLAVELATHLRTVTAADTAEDIRARTAELAADVWIRHGQTGIDELRRLAGAR